MMIIMIFRSQGSLEAIDDTAGGSDSINGRLFERIRASAESVQ